MGLGLLGLSTDEFYSMTWGNFNRRVLGYVRNQWTGTRDIIAAVYDVMSKKGHRVRAEDVFPFGITRDTEDTKPTDEDRKEMMRRHEHRIRHEQD